MLRILIFGLVDLCLAPGNMTSHFRSGGRQMWPGAGRIPGTVTPGAGKGESDVGEEQEDPES